MALFNFYMSEKKNENESGSQTTKKKKVGTMNVALIISCLIMIVFTAVMIWVFIRQDSVPDTLITCVFAVLGGECGVLGWIKTTKCKTSDKTEKKSDEEAKG